MPLGQEIQLDIDHPNVVGKLARLGVSIIRGFSVDRRYSCERQQTCHSQMTYFFRKDVNDPARYMQSFNQALARQSMIFKLIESQTRWGSFSAEDDHETTGRGRGVDQPRFSPIA